MPSIVPPPLGRLRVFYILSSIHLKNTAFGQVFAKSGNFIVAQTSRFVKPPDGNTQGCLIKKDPAFQRTYPRADGTFLRLRPGRPGRREAAPLSTMWGFPGGSHPGRFSFPSFSLINQRKGGAPPCRTKSIYFPSQQCYNKIHMGTRWKQPGFPLNQAIHRAVNTYYSLFSNQLSAVFGFMGGYHV